MCIGRYADICIFYYKFKIVNFDLKKPKISIRGKDRAAIQQYSFLNLLYWSVNILVVPDMKSVPYHRIGTSVLSHPKLSVPKNKNCKGKWITVLFTITDRNTASNTWDSNSFQIFVCLN